MSRTRRSDQFADLRIRGPAAERGDKGDFARAGLVEDGSRVFYVDVRDAGGGAGRAKQTDADVFFGFGLYCQLLKRTIAMMKGEKVKEVIDVKLNLDFANPRLPYEYIEEDVQRLSLMKRFAEAQDVRIVKALAAEMKDRFGPLPDEAKEYVRIAELRVLCAAARITNIDVKGARAVFYRTGSRDIAFVSTLRGRTADAKIGELIRTTRSRQP